MSVLQQVTFTDKTETKEIIREVVDATFNSVCSTLGPDGCYVVINNLNQSIVTKDGVSVAKSMDFGEVRRNLIANLIKEPALRTDTEVGDGTTTTVFLTTKLYNAFGEFMNFQNTRFVDKLVRYTVCTLGDMVIKVDNEDERFRLMLNTTANYETEIVDRFLEIYRNYGTPNVILRKNHNLPEDLVQEERAICFRGGFPSSAMNDLACVVTRAPQGVRYAVIPAGTEVVVMDTVVESMFMEDMAAMVAGTNNPVVIMARSWSQTAIQHIAIFMQNNPGSAIIPYRMEAGGTLGTSVLKELADVLGVNTSVTMEGAVQLLKATDIEFALSPNGVVVERTQEAAEKRAQAILESIVPQYEGMDVAARQTPIGMSLMGRIGVLRGNNIIITVTGQTVSDMNERYYRYEDVMKAAKTAISFGVLPGIGWGYLTAAAKVEAHYDMIPMDKTERELLDLYLDVLRQPYEHLTGFRYRSMDKLRFIDLTDGSESDFPDKVYDNAAAVTVALKGAWATAKTLGKLSTVNGRGDKDYLGMGK